MNSVIPQTLVVSNRHALRCEMHRAALEGRSGLRILTIQALAEKLAGGICKAASQSDIKESLRGIVEKTPIGEFDRIKHLPGFSSALCASLTQCWKANLSLKTLASASSHTNSQPRLNLMYELEQKLRASMKPGSLLLPDLVQQAVRRREHAKPLLGSLFFKGFVYLDPLWQFLVSELCNHLPVTCDSADVVSDPWLKSIPLETTSLAPVQPEKRRWIACETLAVEMKEAMRWARRLITKDGVSPADIGLVHHAGAAGNTMLISLARASGLPLHFVQGRPALELPEGQLAAALAEIRIKGVSRSGVIRIVELLQRQHPAYAPVKIDWWHSLPNLPLKEMDDWHYHLNRLKETAESDQLDALERIYGLVREITQPDTPAGLLGERLLPDKALSVWNHALAAGPAKALDLLLKELNLQDPSDPAACIQVGGASILNAAPRRFTWVSGLNHGIWPSSSPEDALLPSHILDPDLYRPIKADELARRYFERIEQSTSSELVCSYHLQNENGSKSSPSIFFQPATGAEVKVHRTQKVVHSLTHADRMLSRPEIFLKTNLGSLARQTWTDWHRSDMLRSHDGGLHSGHPLIAQCLNRSHSATSLKRLLRDPLGYLWGYGFGWQAPERTAQTLELNAKQFGSLLHSFLEEALLVLTDECEDGMAKASESALRSALLSARETIESRWRRTEAIPPMTIWQTTLNDIQELALGTLQACQPENGWRSWSEIPFGGQTGGGRAGASVNDPHPWDSQQPVSLPGTEVSIKGYIDRLDLSPRRENARVYDFKTTRGKPAEDGLERGQELQRCLYTAAVKSLLGAKTIVEPILIYPRQECHQSPLSNPDDTLAELADVLNLAFEAFEKGMIFSGPETEENFYDFRFALPAQALNRYLKKKKNLVDEKHPLGKKLWNIS